MEDHFVALVFITLSICYATLRWLWMQGIPSAASSDENIENIAQDGNTVK